MVTGRKLLLADDSATIQKVVDLTFSDEGLEVITVGDGQQAIEMLDEVTPDIVLADVFMPGLNGYQVCEYIKRTERFQHIPVMLLVGSFEPFDEAEARRVGADDYLTKPFQSIRTLIGKVGNLLSGGDRGSEEATTRRLAPPPEAIKENLPDEEFIERSTADTARLPDYEQEEMQRGDNRRVGSLADLSMDDQLIEAMPADDYSNPSAQYARPTAQYSAADLKEAGITQATERAPAPEREAAVSSAYAPAQVVESAPPAAVGQSPVGSRAGSLAASDDALLDLGDLEPPQALSEADDFFLDLLDEAPEQPSRSSAPSLAATYAPQNEAAAASSPAEEMDANEGIEEGASVADYQSSETASLSAHGEFSANLQSAPTERLPDAFQMTEAPAGTFDARGSDEAASSAAPVTGQITLEQLSPEVIDAIARRAVEHLSERVVEQIAWEVVPDLAELIIKRRLEQEK